MHLDRTLLLLVALGFGASSCSREPTTKNPPPTSIQPASPTAQVKLKGPDALRNDLARALSLDAGEVCNELGQYSCTDAVHRVTLGGVAPYDRQIYEPARHTNATTPLAAERVVLAACSERAKRDFEAPDSAVLWTGLTLKGSGLADIHSKSVDRAIDGLYVQLLSRHAAPYEVEALRHLYEEIASKDSDHPAESWASLACFAAGTSVEFLFY